MGGQLDHLTRPTKLDNLLIFPRIMTGVLTAIRDGSFIFEVRALNFCMRTLCPYTLPGNLYPEAYGQVAF